MYHLVMTLRPHRCPNHAQPVLHEYPAVDLADAIAICREKMRDNYADPLALQNEDRTQHMDTKTLVTHVNQGA